MKQHIIWQCSTGLHRGGKGGEDYVYGYQHLFSLDLQKEGTRQGGARLV